MSEPDNVHNQDAVVGNTEADDKRRRFLLNTTLGVAALGGAGLAVPFVASMTPSARAKAQGAPVSVDISKVQPGQMIKVEWRRKPIYIVNRTEEMLQGLPKLGSAIKDPESERSEQPVYAKNETRSIRPELAVILGVCTHLGCAPVEKFEVGPAAEMGDNWFGGFYCPCHGSKFDLAGRVYDNVPAPTNLPIPPYSFIDENTLLIGVDPVVEEGSAA